MALYRCKHCHGTYGNAGKGHVVTSENRANSYGYCSWQCLEADDPELAEKIKAQDARTRAIAIAVIVGIITALWSGIKWLMKIRKENPPLFKKVITTIIVAVVLIFGFVHVRGCNQRKAREASDCQYNLGMYQHEVQEIISYSEDTKGDIQKQIDKIDITCPSGGTYKYEVSGGKVKVRCTKHGKYKEDE